MTHASDALALGFKNAADFGCSPAASAMENTFALQRAVEGGGTVAVSAPGNYQIGGTVYLESQTSLIFGNGVCLQKSDENGPTGRDAGFAAFPTICA